MKKVELHVHLDGSLNLDYASKLLGYNAKEAMVDQNSNNLHDYLNKFDIAIKLLQNKENIKNFSYLLGKDLLKDEVIYAEIRFCPLFHTSILNTKEVIEAVIEGLNKTNLKYNLILCMMRNFDKKKNMEIVKLTETYLHKGVCGIDLAGDESTYKTSYFKPLFQIIKKKKIPFTIHAGEADNYTSIDDAISFGAKRIGHGVNAIQNKKTIQNIIKKNITLEVCPTSNIDTNIYPSIKDHPIKELMNLGIKITINTDNRTVSNITLSEEYKKLQDYLQFTQDDFLKCNLNAIEAAFLSNKEKENLKKELQK